MSGMARRELGTTGLQVAPIGFGAFKIGRNTGIKYPRAYELPDDRQTAELLDTILELGINLIDTAPAYGLAEERIGKHLSIRRAEFVLSGKAGEQFDERGSRYDFSRDALRESVQTSLRRLRTDVLDLLLLHTHSEDVAILRETDAVATLQDLKSEGLVRAIGMSGKTPAGAAAALAWADVLMVEYHCEDESHAEILRRAQDRGVGVLVKKGLASGRLPAERAIEFVLHNPAVDALVLGGLNPGHFRENCRVAATVRPVEGPQG